MFLMQIITLGVTGIIGMDALPDEPIFSPEFYESGAGCSWRFSHGPTLSMNEWFIAGPGPGVYREEWLADALAFRNQIREGRGRVLEMNASHEEAWLRPAAGLAEALALAPGESLYLALRARVVNGGEAALLVSFNNAPTETVASITVPGDGNWHEVEASVVVPASGAPEAPLRPVVRLDPAAPQARLEVASMILSVDDASRMVAVSRLLHSQETNHLCRGIYEREDLAWAASAYTHYFVFMYDRGFYDPELGYQVEAFLEDKERRFGGVDAVILWPAYPRIGVDARNQFDFLRDMPGGLEGLRDVCRRFQARGVRVLLPYLPWDTSTRRESVSDEEALAMMVGELGVDGIFLDTLTDASTKMRHAVDAANSGVVLVPELCPPLEQLSLCNASWAQWPHDPTPPGIPLLKWVEPRHTQHFTRRWDASHRWEMETAFFNGTGMLLWENIFGTHNPCSREDALFWKRCAAISRVFHREFSSELWDPFYPSMNADLYIHRWPGAPTTLFTLRNLGEPIEYGLLMRWQLPAHVRADNMQVFDLWRGRMMRWDMSEFGWVHLWGDVGTVGCIAVTFGDDPRLEDLIAAQAALEAQAATSEPPMISMPALIPVEASERTTREQPPERMVYVPGGTTRMHIAHQRRESGCYPDPTSDPADAPRFIWGHPHDGMVTHDYEVAVAPFFIDEAQVSNRAFQQFLRETGYAPEHAHNFLKHWPEGVMPDAIAELPVVYVDLDDARAYARWAGKRLPTEPEWQRAAQGDDGRRWPWGDDFQPEHCPPPNKGPLPVRALPDSRSPYGCYLMAGNVWEWTESERDDGNTRFCIIRGGSYYDIEGSGWYAQGGPQPLDAHTKFLMLWPGLDRCATIGFRCVKDVAVP